LVFQPSPFQKLFSPLLQLRERGAGQQHAHGEQGTPSQGSLRCSHVCAAPHSQGLGQRHAHGGNGVYTILGFFFFFSFLFFLFLWGSKNGLQQMPPLYNTYGAEILCSKFYKDK
jgi:hypothetical protein